MQVPPNNSVLQALSGLTQQLGVRARANAGQDAEAGQQQAGGGSSQAKTSADLTQGRRLPRGSLLDIKV